MNERDQQEYLEGYKQAKQAGIHFFPDALVKDALLSLLVFAILVALAYFVGAPLEARADPTDASYTPRPEWYFLFLFQLLKFFPGSLEVVGVFVIPTLAVLVLLALPFLDRTRWRSPLKRPLVTGTTGFLVVAVAFLTVQAMLEAPPPVEAVPGDPVAALYAQNCAGCHGPMVVVPAGTNLHEVIAQGSHEGMPAWSGDLTSDEIDALAGFILSPGGSQVFNQNCGACHVTADLVAGDPAQLDQALQQGPDFPPHQDLAVPTWTETLAPDSRTALLNFLSAPDGQRLFQIDCSGCHGQSVAVAGDAEAVREIIARGGLHLQMPPWRQRLTDAELDTLARYVVQPAGNQDAVPLFSQNCTSCHGQLVPRADSLEQARDLIASGGSHQTMPVWGEVLTSQQLDALVEYTLQAATGSPLEQGRALFGENCSGCHGDFGEGGPNPTRAGDIIAPISSAEYLTTRDDTTLKAIVAQGQPNFGMSPFGTQFGGPLDDDQISAIVTFLRSWQANPPVEVPPDIPVQTLAETGAEVYADVCSQCHGPDGGGGVGSSLRAPAFQNTNSDQDIFDTITVGHEATPMIAWGDILNAEQIQQLVSFIRTFGVNSSTGSGGSPSFASDVLPILQTECSLCHGTLGGWDASSFDSVMNSGDNAPVIIAGDVEHSLLAQKLQGTQQTGSLMPPSGALPADQIQIILDWIAAGALDD